MGQCPRDCCCKFFGGSTVPTHFRRRRRITYIHASVSSRGVHVVQQLLVAQRPLSTRRSLVLLQQQQQRDLSMWSRTRMPKILSFIALNWWSFSDAVAAAALNPEKRSPLQEEDVVLHISVINMALGVCSPSSGRLYCHPPPPPPLHVIGRWTQFFVVPPK